MKTTIKKIFFGFLYFSISGYIFLSILFGLMPFISGTGFNWWTFGVVFGLVWICVTCSILSFELIKKIK